MIFFLLTRKDSQYFKSGKLERICKGFTDSQMTNASSFLKLMCFVFILSVNVFCKMILLFSSDANYN